MKIITTLSLTFLSFIFVHSQNIEREIIDLNQLVTYETYTIPFEIAEIIDERRSKTQILSEFDYKKKHIVVRLKESLEHEVGYHIKKKYKTDSLSKIKIRIGIDYIHVGHPRFSRGNATIQFRFYNLSESDISSINNQNPIISIVTTASNFDVNRNKNSPEKLSVAIHKALTIFNEFFNQNFEFINKKPVTNNRGNNLQKGIYSSQNDFLNNEPIFNADVKITPLKKDRLGGNLYSIRFKDQRLQKKDISNLIWGFSDGVDQYFSVKNYQNTNAFSKIEHQGEGYFVIHHNQNPIPVNQQIGLGAATVLGIAAGVLTGTYVLPYLKDYKGKVVIDLKNNQVFPADYKFLFNSSKSKSFKKKLKRIQKKNFDQFRNEIIDDYMRYKN